MNILGVCLLLLPLLTIIWVFSLIRCLSKHLLQANKGVQHLFQYLSENLILLHKMILPLINRYLLFALTVDQLE